MGKNTGNSERTKEFWEAAKKFHGHECPGLAVGVRVCDAAIEKMGLKPSSDEELVCVTENDACCVDAIQVILGCTIGKGNLIYKGTGKTAFTFVKRKDGKAMRFYLKARNVGMDWSAYQQYLLNAPVDELFTIQEAPDAPPETARIFMSVECEECGEFAPEHTIRLQEGRKLCFDCFKTYSRGW